MKYKTLFFSQHIIILAHFGSHVNYDLEPFWVHKDFRRCTVYTPWWALIGPNVWNQKPGTNSDPSMTGQWMQLNQKLWVHRLDLNWWVHYRVHTKFNVTSYIRSHTLYILKNVDLLKKMFILHLFNRYTKLQKIYFSF